MENYLDPESREKLKPMLDGMPRKVGLLLFRQQQACPMCREQERLLSEMAGLSDKITLAMLDHAKDRGKADLYGIDKVPATVVLAGEDLRIRFFGLTAGYEFQSLLEAVLLAASANPGFKPELSKLIALLDEPVHLEVMVTLTCPYCPQMVHLAHRIAAENPNVRADMVESSSYPHLVQRYNVGGVPRLIVNGVPSSEGVLSETETVLEIIKIAKPAVFDRINRKIRESRGELKARRLSADQVYDVLIAGAGPAAFSAAVYAARKNMSVGLLGETVGGQMASTATVENWPGTPSQGGRELAQTFRDHAERYPIHEELGARVSSIARKAGLFTVSMEDGHSFRAKTVIYCCGASYRRLNAPGESRFLGRGVAFCATCDAPLYKDRKVAVIGGGNSAFTAVRDLLHWASEIHVVNIVEGFQADEVLLSEVSAHPNVRFHPHTRVLEYLGADKLTGIRVRDEKSGVVQDLQVDGVFLEIGLSANTAPVKKLLALNDNGEIPVERDQSTKIPGFFAAGDATDEPEKQIVTAAAAGAKAALAAYEYLQKRKTKK
ncbi:MAG: FAD-dependent oxidoreductase [Thermodesulfobacteriota bacterium]